jgi:2-phospho-L-lactate transferase/gluconeogenesis factor (CofD/UPF0052 family)
MAVKRWVLVYVLALTLVALGMALMLTHLYRNAPFPEPVYYATLQFVPRLARGLLLVLIGAGLMGWATWKLVATFVGLLLPHFPYRGRHPGRFGLGEALWAQRILSRGPRVVAIGGGTGLSTLLRGLKLSTSNLTAVVTVCDDGGSSGRLRRDLRVLPPGDFRQCIAALADSDPLVTALFEHRFAEAADGQRHDLAGHAFGNLYIAAMAQITGSFERALEESARVLNVRGRILPSTLEDVTLCAELADRSTVAGESLIPERAQPGHGGHGDHGDHGDHGAGHGPAAAGAHAVTAAVGVGATPNGAAAAPEILDTRALQALTLSAPPPAARPADDGAPDLATAAATGGNPIRRVFLEPEQPPVYPEVVRALLDADLIVIGPGSLYTSILPNLLVGDLARALCWSRAAKVYVCNVATQPGETDGYNVAAHVRAIRAHLAERLGPGVTGVPFTHVLVNSNLVPDIPEAWNVTRPEVGEAERAELAELGVSVLAADVVDEARPTRHDPQKLAQALLSALHRLRPTPGASPLTALRAWTGNVAARAETRPELSRAAFAGLAEPAARRR